MKQQYSVIVPSRLPDGGLSMKKQIEALNKQILQLELQVKMKNPNYQPPRPDHGGSALHQINQSRQQQQQQVGKTHDMIGLWAYAQGKNGHFLNHKNSAKKWALAEKKINITFLI